MGKYERSEVEKIIKRMKGSEFTAKMKLRGLGDETKWMNVGEAKLKKIQKILEI